MEQQQNKGKLENFMADLGRKLDGLLERARHETEEAKLEEKFEEKMEDLKHAKDKLERELHEFVKDDEKWKEVQSRLQGAAQELKKAFEITFTRRKNDNNQQPSDTYQHQSAQSTQGPANPGGDTGIY